LASRWEGGKPEANATLKKNCMRQRVQLSFVEEEKGKVGGAALKKGGIGKRKEKKKESCF